MPSRRLRLIASDRGMGQTTALLDIACANARRGKTVAFWSSHYPSALHNFRLLQEVLDGDASVKGVTNTPMQALFKSGGRIIFTCDSYERRGRDGYGVFMHVDDASGLIEFTDG
ncbi:hypothetical protein Porky_117 [Mycobacterium phage Porky]|uniref:Uncharacterized protein n=1 Tax=Mycobacterium phage Porky TaxID=2914015 RepID=B5A677_9CAUD|nr:hypothetical protein Porky_117 [Mycobacterium phage Porky]ACF33932.1 hypothetical protein Porky_117 [Mycobacterium phage Porky]